MADPAPTFFSMSIAQVVAAGKAALSSCRRSRDLPFGGRNDDQFSTTLSGKSEGIPMQQPIQQPTPPPSKVEKTIDVIVKLIPVVGLVSGGL